MHAFDRRTDYREICLLVLLVSGALHAQPYGLPGPRQASPGYLSMPQSPPAPSGNWLVDLAFPNLTFVGPLSLQQAPRSNRLYVTEREGRIYSFQNDRASSAKTLVLDISAKTQGWDDCGLMSMAFHSQFGLAGSANRGYFYVYYQYNPTPVPGPGRPPTTTPTFNRVSRFTIPDGQLTADPASELVLINQHDRNVWHGGGAMLFHPVDGFLYFTIGDEGNADDSYDVTQRINDKLFGGVFRIDVDKQGGAVSHPIRRQPQSYVDRPSSTANYYIPNDNPWQDAGGGVLEEFYALGVRSPHRLTYDPVRAQILLGDVGQGAVEEIDIIEKGKNYQWPYREGKSNGPKAKPGTIIGTDAPPIYDYRHGGGTFEGNCIIGGYVYRGQEHAASLGGKYLFGDNTYGRIWSLDLSTNQVEYLVNMPSGTNYSGLSSFGVDSSGELFMLKMNEGGPGGIYKLSREGTSGPAAPALLSQTGAFTNVATLQSAAGLVPFDVGSPLWSDGAHKQRWMSLPYSGTGAGTKITFAPTGEWQFPDGTVFVKHFELTINEQTQARRRLETRLLVRQVGGGVYGVTYKWRADGSDADLLVEGLDEQVSVMTAAGPVSQTWRYPSSVQCLSCHNINAGSVLGVKTRQLNNEILYVSSGVADNQLRSLNHLGLFNPAINEASIPGYASLVAVDDTSASLEHRVRSHLDANCAHCHRPGGVQAFFDARFDTPLESQGIVDQPPANSLGIDGAAVVKPRDRWRSVLHVRDSSKAPNVQMPPLARNVPDDTALSVLAQWIDSLPGTPALAPPQISPPGGGFEDSVVVALIHPDPSAIVRFTLDGSDPTPASPVYASPITLTDSAVVSARAYEPGFVNSVRATADFTSALAGLTAEYFDNINFTGTRVTRVDPTVDFDWAGGSPDPAIGPDTFSVRWTGQVEALLSEAYTFYTSSDDGVRLWIDDQLVIDNWTDHAPVENSGVVSLSAGRSYSIKMEMYENGGGAVARLLWSSAGTPKQVIPQARLFSAPRSMQPDIESLACGLQGEAARLAWTNEGDYGAIRVYQYGELVATLPPEAETTTLPLDPVRSIHRFRVASVVGGAERGGQSCEVLTVDGEYIVAIDEDFSPTPGPLALDMNCNAAVRNGALELTEPLFDQAGSAFLLPAQPNQDFIAEFDFNFPEPSSPGADGLAFIVNTGSETNLCGAPGGAMGFRTADDGVSVYPGFAVVFDTWQNPGEISHNWVGFVDFALGGLAQVDAAVPEEFCGNGVFHVTVIGSQGDFAVTLSNSSIGMGERQVLSYTIDGFQPRSSYFGFSAGTGGAYARHIVDNFKLRTLTTSAPAAAFTGSPRLGAAPLSVSFTSTSQGAIQSYSWSFGDGGTSNLQNPGHTYQSAGTFTVRLTVTGPGGTNTKTSLGYITASAPPQGRFIRGDSNGSTVVDISDAVFLLLYAFNGSVTTNCPDALDADDNGQIQVNDALRILRYIFASGQAPAAPFPAADMDTTADGLPTCQRGL